MENNETRHLGKEWHADKNWNWKSRWCKSFEGYGQETQFEPSEGMEFNPDAPERVKGEVCHSQSNVHTIVGLVNLIMEQAIP